MLCMLCKQLERATEQQLEGAICIDKWKYRRAIEFERVDIITSRESEVYPTIVKDKTRKI